MDAMPADNLLNSAARDSEAMLALNNDHAQETSLLDRDGLDTLLRAAFFARGVDCGATAFLIALDENAAYINPNFQWFKNHRASFVYVDRMIVSPGARGRGIAKGLYEDLFAEARQAGFDRIVCEVNLEPPNPASDVFHAAMGFTMAGEASIHQGAKRVRYLEKRLV